jgi:hypothetical protein
LDLFKKKGRSELVKSEEVEVITQIRGAALRDESFTKN